MTKVGRFWPESLKCHNFPINNVHGRPCINVLKADFTNVFQVFFKVCFVIGILIIIIRRVFLPLCLYFERKNRKTDISDVNPNTGRDDSWDDLTDDDDFTSSDHHHDEHYNDDLESCC